MDISRIISVITFSMVVYFVYTGLKAYVLDKININKWVIFTLAVASFAVSLFFSKEFQSGIAVYVISGVFMIFLLWFFDLHSLDKKRKKDNIVIRPKAKPNRVKKNLK